MEVLNKLTEAMISRHFFEYVKDWISSADLAIGDYEGTISPDDPFLGGIRFLMHQVKSLTL